LEGWSEEANAAEIVGVVGDTKYRLIDAHADVDLYVSYLQAAPHSESYLTIKTAAPPEMLIPSIRAEVQSLDPLVPIFSVSPLRDVLSNATARPRFNSVLLAVFAALALIVAGVGVYGMLAYTVTQRTHEIGIRIALGAKPSQVARLVIGDGFVLCLAGLALGLTGAFGATRLLRGLLFQTAPADPVTFAIVAVLLLALAPIACYLPARRATRVDPIVALRSE
jgi:putative ABC transport system permease protein